MGTFDDILNATIPIIVVIVALYLLSRPFKEPLKGLWNGIKSLIGKAKGENPAEDYQKTLQFE